MEEISWSGPTTEQWVSDKMDVSSVYTYYTTESDGSETQNQINMQMYYCLYDASGLLYTWLIDLRYSDLDVVIDYETLEESLDGLAAYAEIYTFTDLTSVPSISSGPTICLYKALHALACVGVDFDNSSGASTSPRYTLYNLS